ncbi:MAG: DsbE family thiol:disulfide interchange protein [Gammaproteobacteria bacterium]|nr:DsbE family thiol:disulfide interchange protein [Gammaproteobacteria bacterium]
MKIRVIIPFLIFISIVIILWRGLGLQPAKVPSPLIGKPAPSFQLPLLFDPQKITHDKDLKGHITLLNVWATWCTACAEEHDALLHISKNDSFVLYGLDYKDDPDKAKDWLQKNGNPYKLVAMDKAGLAAIDWGVYGTPETFVIDKSGVVRYKQIGPITSEVWSETFLPLLAELQNEPQNP